MFRGRALRRILPAILVLVWAAAVADPALLIGRVCLTAGSAPLRPLAAPAAAAPCTANCYRMHADIALTVSHPAVPVFPGSIHQVTVWVTNSGWRTGGNSGPTPWPGPNSGPVEVRLWPGSPDEYAIASDHGTSGFSCVAATNGPLCTSASVPAGTTVQFAVSFQAPPVPGTYPIQVFADSPQWTEYDENNNGFTLTYQIGYLA